jgi:hypothetical protein
MRASPDGAFARALDQRGQELLVEAYPDLPEFMQRYENPLPQQRAELASPV